MRLNQVFPSPCGEVVMNQSVKTKRLSFLHNEVSVPLRGSGNESMLGICQVVGNLLKKCFRPLAGKW